MFDPIKAMLPDSVADVARVKRELQAADTPRGDAQRAQAAGQRAQSAGERIGQRLDTFRTLHRL